MSINRELFRFLDGEYKLVRNIINGTIRTTIVGHAAFQRKSKNEIEYYETGNYNIEDIQYDFYQVRKLRVDGDYLLILKSDGTILHQFPLSDHKVLKDVHLCGQDEYAVEISWTGKTLKSIYKVKGPTKNYLISTLLSKKN